MTPSDRLLVDLLLWWGVVTMLFGALVRWPR